MKAILEFNLPEEQSDHRLAIDGYKYNLVIWKYENEVLRKWLKYGHKFKTANEALTAARKELWDLMDEYGLKMDED